MKFPYTLSDFGTLRQDGYFYQDRSDRSPQLEDAGRQLIFIRPCRFGKTGAAAATGGASKGTG